MVVDKYNNMYMVGKSFVLNEDLLLNCKFKLN